MKILCVVFGLLILLSGCAAQDTLETLGNVLSEQDMLTPAEVDFLIPQGEEVEVIRGETGSLYLCDGYEIAVEILASGNLSKTVETLSGFDRSSLTVMETGTSDLGRFECVWTSAGEAGDQVGRTVILDDGKFHYCLTLTTPAEESGGLQETWQEIISSFSLKG